MQNDLEGDRSSIDEQELLESWVDDHADALFRFALTKVSDQHVVEDLLQETYLAAIRAYASFRGDSSVRSWLIAILRLKIVDHFRRQARNKEKEGFEEAVAAEGQFREDRLTAWDVSKHSSVEREEFWEVFRGCLEKLPETLGTAYLMREIDEQSVEQVCNNLRISSKNLAVRLFRARTMLRDCLDRNWFRRELQ